MTPRSSTSTSGGGIDLLTLAITAIASAAAAYACSQIWAPGTLASAAMTPVLVALIKEGLFRPAKAVTQVVPVRGVVRSASGPAGTQVNEVPDAVVAPVEPGPAPPDLERVAQQGEISYHSAGAARRWRLAIITGLLGFLVAAVLFTVPELVTGKAASGSGSTTLFGGGKSGSALPTQTTTVPGRTVTQPPPVTVTQPPPVTVTAPPVVTVPAPTSTTTTPLPAPSGAGSSGPASTVPTPASP